MQSLRIQDTKTFMISLFTKEVFDSMEVEDLQIVTSCCFRVDGRTVKDFYSQEELSLLDVPLPEFVSWQSLRPFALSLIKGKKTPVSFRIILHANRPMIEQCTTDDTCTVRAENVQSMVLNIRFENGICHLITGTSLTTFFPDHSLDQVWDRYIREFLTKREIRFEAE